MPGIFAAGRVARGSGLRVSRLPAAAHRAVAMEGGADR